MMNAVCSFAAVIDDYNLDTLFIFLLGFLFCMFVDVYCLDDNFAECSGKECFSRNGHVAAIHSSLNIVMKILHFFHHLTFYSPCFQNDVLTSIAYS